MNQASEQIAKQYVNAGLNKKYWGDVLVNVMVYGAAGDGIKDDTAAIRSALAYLVSKRGGILLFPPGTYLISGTIDLSVGILVRGSGVGATIIQHTGNGACFRLYAVQNYNVRHGIHEMAIYGNAGANAIGIEVADTFAFEFNRVLVRDYANGIGVLLHNRNLWVEGTISDDLHIKNCKTALRFERSTGTDSYAYSRFRNLFINIPTNGVGLDFGGTSGNSIYVYNCDFDATIWHDETDNSTAVLVRAGANVTLNRYHIVGEGKAAHPTQRGIMMAGGSLKGEGFIQILDVTDDITLGSVKIIAQVKTLDNKSGTDADGNIFRSVISDSIDLQHGASFGYYKKTGIESPFIAMFDGANNALMIKAVSFGSNIADAPTVAEIGKSGDIRPQSNRSNAKIISAGWQPDGVEPAEPGSIHLRSDVGEFWYKESGTGTTGWIRVQGTKAGTTANRPATNRQLGMMYFDTTLAKPIWWDSSNWRDAAGTVV